MTNEELLFNFQDMMSIMLDEKFKRELTPIKEDLGELKDRMSAVESRLDRLEQRMDGLEQRMDGLEQRMDGLEKRMDSLELRVSGLELEVGSLREDMDTVKERLTTLEDKVLKISFTLENQVLPQISLLAENYVPAAKRYEREAERIDNLAADVSLLKLVVEQHSIKLGALS